jgi:prepilin signal peptidase PulO-like enzyme (type II secretory pathway)
MFHVSYPYLVIFLLVVAISDFGFQKISNQLTYPVFTLLIYHLILEGSKDLLLSMEGIGVGIAGLITPS